jgi:hypothetical protein
MKTNTITLRVSDCQKNKLEDLGFDKGKSKSEIIRSIIEDFFNSPDNLTEIQSYAKNTEIDFVQTLGFSELIFWIYAKMNNPEINETNEFYIQLINEIEKLKKHPLFSDEIINEFNKIYRELQDYLGGISFLRNEFRFCQADNQNAFNYGLFADFFYGIRYDEFQNRVLNIQ